MPLVMPSGSLFGQAAGNPCVLPTNYIADVLADSPIGYWQLNDPRTGPSSPIADSSGNARDGVVTEVGIDPLYQQPGPFGIGDCCFSSELAGSGGSYITFATTAFDSIVGAPSQDFTMEIWQRVPTSGSGSPNVFFDKTDTSPANWNTMQILTDGRFNAQLYDGSNNPSVNRPGSVEDGSWHQFVLVRETTGTPRILTYYDGALVGTSAVSAAVDTSNITKLTIGAREAGGDRPINHAVAHAAVYSTALTVGRILSHYTVGTTAP